MFWRVVFFCVFLVTLLLQVLVGQPQGNSKQVGSPFSQAQFVPDIAVIVDGSVLTRTITNDAYSQLQTPEFIHPHGGDAHGETLTRRGFNLNYSELSLYSIVDPYFDLFAVLHLTQDHAGVEEAYFTTRKVPCGFQVKAGKFLSSFGRLNDQHSHTHDFADRPLILTSFFGDEGLNDLGARITWVAPIDIYLMLGGEVFMGENEGSFGKAAITDLYGNVNLAEVEYPSLVVGYSKTSFDVGRTTFLLGASIARGKFRHDHDFSTNAPTGHAVDGRTTIFGSDVTLKYVIDPIRSISFQAEYLHRIITGTVLERQTTSVSSSLLKRVQSGTYAQVIAKTGVRWRVGVRYDLLMANRTTVGGTRETGPSNLPRYSGMIEYNVSEYSRFRIQVTHDRSKYLENGGTLSRQPYTEVQLQCTFGIGAHAAHPF